MTERDDREKAAHCVLDFFNQLPKDEKTLLRSVFLNVVAEQVAKSPERENRFSANELAEKIRATGSVYHLSTNRGNETKWINDIYRDLNENTAFCGKLRQFAKARNLSFYPWIDKERGGGRGKLSYYSLITKDFSEEEPIKEQALSTVNSVNQSDIRTLAQIDPQSSVIYLSQVESSATPDIIDYVRKPPSVGKWWIHKADEFVLKGWKLWLYLFTPFFAGFLTFIFIAEISAFLVAFCIVYFYSPYAVVRRGIVLPLSSSLSFLFNINPVYLECVRTEGKNRFGNLIRKLRWSTYSGICPICKDRVIVEKNRFFGSLVGRCLSNPQQHIFDFDHTILKGKRMNKK